jgi:hypothetical protein
MHKTYWRSRPLMMAFGLDIQGGDFVQAIMNQID